MSVVRRLVWLILLLPLAGLLVALAVANRHVVRLVLDPLAPQAPALAVEAPFFVYLLAMLIGGVAMGGVATWLGQAKWRKAARKHGRDAVRWQRESERLSQQIEDSVPPRLPRAVGE